MSLQLCRKGGVKVLEPSLRTACWGPNYLAVSHLRVPFPKRQQWSPQ